LGINLWENGERIKDSNEEEGGMEEMERDMGYTWG
jgi:hypothetical protein